MRMRHSLGAHKPGAALFEEAGWVLMAHGFRTRRTSNPCSSFITSQCHASGDLLVVRAFPYPDWNRCKRHLMPLEFASAKQEDRRRKRLQPCRIGAGPIGSGRRRLMNQSTLAGGGVFDFFKKSPRPTMMDQFRLAESNDRLGKDAIVGVSNGGGRGFHADLGQSRRTAKRQVLRAGIRMIYPCTPGRRPTAPCLGKDQTPA